MPVRTIRFQETEGPNWAERAFAGHEAIQKAQVMESTWGHLAPKQGRKYQGYMVFCIGCFGDLTVIDFEFKARGRVLDSSPWLYEDLHRFIGDFYTDEECQGKVYRFDGTYSQSAKTGDYSFDGRVAQCSVTPGQPDQPE